MGSQGGRLAAEVIGGFGSPALADELAGWIDAKPGFRAFVEANATKIRRKVREARDEDSVRDVRAELLVAARLLADRRMALAFEASGAGRGGPDFTVTFREVTRFTLEVTRRRGGLDGPAVVEAGVAKLRQLPPGVANLVVVAGDGRPDAASIAEAARVLRARVDAREAATLARLRVERPRDFYERFLRLSGLLAWADAAPAGERVAAWPNPSARHVLERGAWKAVEVALAGSG